MQRTDAERIASNLDRTLDEIGANVAKLRDYLPPGHLEALVLGRLRGLLGILKRDERKAVAETAMVSFDKWRRFMEAKKHAMARDSGRPG